MARLPMHRVRLCGVLTFARAITPRRGACSWIPAGRVNE